jgi:hypothetical protein
VSDRIDNWTNLNPAYRPIVFVHDGGLRVIGDDWFRAKGTWPTLEEAQRYGIDGYETYTELVLYNSAHLRRLTPTEAAPVLRDAIDKIQSERNLGDGIRAVAKELLSPEEHADFITRTYVKGLKIVDHPLKTLALNPTRRSLEHMVEIAFAEHLPHGVVSLAKALDHAGDEGLSTDERASRRAIRRAIAALSKKIDGKNYEAALPIYRKGRAAVLEQVKKILAAKPTKGASPRQAAR